MTSAQIEQTKASVQDAVAKIAAIDAKIAEFQAQYKKLLEMRSKGVLFCAKTVKTLPGEARDAYLDELNTRDVALAADIRKMMFMFEDIAKLDKRHIQKIMFKCDLKDIAHALKLSEGAEIKKYIMSNISRNNIALVNDEIERMGDAAAVDRAEVLAAQRRILDVALELEAAGEIFFPEDL